MVRTGERKKQLERCTLELESNMMVGRSQQKPY